MTTAKIKADETLKSFSSMSEVEIKGSKRKYEKLNMDLNKEIAELQVELTNTRASFYDVRSIPEEHSKIEEKVNSLMAATDIKKNEIEINKMIIKGIDKLIDEAKAVKVKDEILKLLKSAGLLDIEKLKERLKI
ncbi:hypothetical protein C7A11_26570 [Pseudomonas simiae]|uniref:hypothetical protein n=1 Tax=Pseudomonas simiae TaxID=321846 RepID=UPI000D047ADA|nr:hypothetical protein [Pseudomonas simiae]PRW84355.1 hypothetical protein C7A11_26570 [Pseudomonas simiae]